MKKQPPPVPVIGASQDSSREDELRAWEEKQRHRQQTTQVPEPVAAPQVVVPAPAAPVAVPAVDASAPVAAVSEPSGYLAMPEFVEPASSDPADRLEHYSRGILAAQYAARANHERAEQQKLIALGLRLQAIKDEELHKHTGFETFGALTDARFGIKKHQANNILRVMPVAQALEDITTQELKERPLRVLVPILEMHGAEAVRETWQEAARHGNVIDKTLLQAANFLGYAPPKEVGQAPEKGEPEKPAVSSASESLKAVERIRTLAETDLERARREAEQLESAVRELLEELAGNLER